MAMFVTKRLLMALATVLVVAVLAFLLVHAMPGSPGAVSLGGAGASQEAIDKLNQSLGWNDPWWFSSSAGWLRRFKGTLESRSSMAGPSARTLPTGFRSPPHWPRALPSSALSSASSWESPRLSVVGGSWTS